MTPRFATLTFERQVTAPVETLWQVWMSCATRALCSAPSPDVAVAYLQADPKVGGITTMTLDMAMSSVAAFGIALGFGADTPGLQPLGNLARAVGAA